MNKKIFAIIMIIALILSSFSLAFANDNDENKEKKEKTANRKIHVHLESDRTDITSVEVEIDGSMYILEPNGNSGNYTTTKVGDTVSEDLTKIIVHTSNGQEAFNPADKSQQGQEGQGSINYRITVTETDENGYESEEKFTGDVEIVTEDIIDNVGNGSSEVTETEGNKGDGGTSETDKDIEGDPEENNNEENTADTSTDSSDATPGDNTPDITDNNTISIATEDETPLGVPEPQEIASSEETTAEDEETPLDIPSTGVATPLLYGAGALISLLGLLKRR